MLASAPPSYLRNRLALLAGLGFLTAACAEKAGPPPATPAKVTSTSELERWFPLEEGKIYQYVTKDNGDTGMLVAKVHRTDATHGELRLSNATKRFAFSSEGVSYEGGAYILKGPIEIGVSWVGEHGGSMRIAATDVSVEVPAGHYAGCLRTVEEGKPKRYEQTYCPGVGMVLLVVTAAGPNQVTGAPQDEGRAELKSYGFPVKIE